MPLHGQFSPKIFIIDTARSQWVGKQNKTFHVISTQLYILFKQLHTRPTCNNERMQRTQASAHRLASTVHVTVKSTWAFNICQSPKNRQGLPNKLQGLCVHWLFKIKSQFQYICIRKRFMTTTRPAIQWSFITTQSIFTPFRATYVVSILSSKCNAYCTT